jgi:hypothetical protein
VLGMRAEGHGDPQIETHPQTLFLTNLHPKMKVLPTFTFSTGSGRPREAQPKVGGRSRGLKVAEVPCQRSTLHQRSEDGEGVGSEVYQADDMAGWTLITFLFTGHRNICKSQRTVR